MNFPNLPFKESEAFKEVLKSVEHSILEQMRQRKGNKGAYGGSYFIEARAKNLSGFRNLIKRITAHECQGLQFKDVPDNDYKHIPNCYRLDCGTWTGFFRVNKDTGVLHGVLALENYNLKGITDIVAEALEDS